MSERIALITGPTHGIGTPTAREIANLTERRFVAVVGEMEGLGPLSSAQHETLGGYLASLSPSAVVAVESRITMSANSIFIASLPFREG